MKRTAYILLALALLTQSSFGNDAYEKVMGENITMIFTAPTTEDLDATANKFARIAEAEGDKWLPFYYGSLTYIFKSFRLTTMEEKDQALASAQGLLDRALELEQNNSEINALQGFLYMISISIDGASRGQTLSPKAFAAFDKALAVEPRNPRALLFKGQMMYGSAQFFGQGTEQACAMINNSIDIFESEEGGATIYPTWGLKSAMDYQKLCNTSAE